MKKTAIFIFLAITVIATGCNEGGALYDELNGNTYYLEGFDEVLESCSGGGSSASDEAVSESTITNIDVSATPTTKSGTTDSDTTTTDSDTTVSFDGSNCTVEEDGVSVFDSCTWSAVDGNTIEATIEGETVTLDVDVNGDTLTVSASEDCDSSGGSSPDDSTSTGLSATSIFYGTWCYQSGYPYYFAVVLSADSDADVAYFRNNEDFTNGVTTDLDYSTRNYDVSVSTYAYSYNETGIDGTALLDFTDSTYAVLTITYGQSSPNLVGYFRKSTSSTVGECPGLTISQDNLDDLP